MAATDVDTIWSHLGHHGKITAGELTDLLKKPECAELLDHYMGYQGLVEAAKATEDAVAAQAQALQLQKSIEKNLAIEEEKKVVQGQLVSW